METQHAIHRRKTLGTRLSAYDNALANTDPADHLVPVMGRLYRSLGGHSLAYQCVRAAYDKLIPPIPNVINDNWDGDENPIELYAR